LGIASSGVHSNGFSLIHKAIPDLNEDFGGMSIGRALLEPTRIYVKPVLALMDKVEIRGMANITGGGFYENVPRMFCHPAPSAAIRDPLKAGYDGEWKIPPIFERIAYGIKNAALPSGLSGAAAQKAGAEILRSDDEIKKLMFNTYNMGVSFVLALAPENVQKAAALLEDMGFPAWEIGVVEKSPNSAGEIRFV
jgi:phosphoribosylformylglycinamidine cyclo-ligase